MKLSFECNLDLRSMPIKHGKKFCDNCQKNVIDLRRKSEAKIASFFEANASPCVIMYQDQLDRLPKRSVHKQSGTLRYFPYAAGIIAVSLLPSVTIAQTQIQPNAQTVGIKPVTLPALENTETNVAEQTANDHAKYYLQGKVSIRDKKFKIKKGKEIVIYKSNNDGTYTEDTLALGKIGANGNFKLELAKPVYDALLLEEDNIYFNIEGFRSEIIEKVSYTQNTIKVNISVSGRRYVIMGALF